MRKSLLKAAMREDNGYHDAAEDNRASYSHHPMEDMEPESAESAAQKLFMQFLDRLIVEVLSESKYRERDLAIFILSTRIGMRDGVTASQLARHYGVTRSAVSKLQVAMLKKLDLPPSILMRRRSSRAAFVSSNPRPMKNGMKF